MKMHNDTDQRKQQTARTGGASASSVQRLVRHPDSLMLDWVALYVTEINTIVSKNGEKIEMLASDEDDCIAITRRAKTAGEAFRKCVREGMTQMPNDKLSHSAAKTKGAP